MTDDAYRRRIERELHDGVQQDLVALIVNLQLARRLLDTDAPAAKALLDEIRADAQAALDRIRALALRIYPPLADAGGLRAALHAAAPEARVEVDLGEDCPEEIAAAVYCSCVDLLPASAIRIHRNHDSLVYEVESDEAGRVSGSLSF